MFFVRREVYVVYVFLVQRTIWFYVTSRFAGEKAKSEGGLIFMYLGIHRHVWIVVLYRRPNYRMNNDA